jgi:hypothetical protein
MTTLFLIRKTFVNGLELHIMNTGLTQQEVEGGNEEQGGVPICSANLSSPVVDTAAYIIVILTTNRDPSIFILFCALYDMKNNSKQRNSLSSTSSSSELKPGRHAPDFTLRTTPDQEVSLSQFRFGPTISFCQYLLMD